MCEIERMFMELYGVEFTEGLQEKLDTMDGTMYFANGVWNKIENGDIFYDYNPETGNCNQKGGKLDIKSMNFQELKKLLEELKDI